MNRTDRLLAIVLELQGRDRVTAEELAAIFEVSKRTIYRDILALNESGVPVVSAAGQGYWLMDGYFLPPVSLNPAEAIMLVLGSELMTHYFDAQYRDAARRASRKIEAVLSEPVAHEVGYLKENIRFVSSDKGALDATETLQLVRRAILEQRCLHLHYAKRGAGGRSDFSERTINPHSLVHFNDSWLVSGYCQLRQAMRVFRLDRIQTLELLSNTFTRQAGFSVYQLRAPEAPRQAIELLFDQTLAPWVREKATYFVRDYHETAAGLHVTLNVHSFEEATPWVLGWGSGVSVLSPDAFKTYLRAELSQMQARLS